MRRLQLRGFSDADDKTRVLMNVISGLSHKSVGFDHSGPAQPGDLVMCLSNTDHEWGISYYVRAEGGEHLLREIGSERLCRMENESVARIVGLRPSRTWDGLRWEFHEKTVQACYRLDDYTHLFESMEFAEDSRSATVFIRRRFGSELHPYALEGIKFKKGISIRAIERQLEAAGFGKKEFTPRTEEEIKAQQADSLARISDPFPGYEARHWPMLFKKPGVGQ